MAKRIDKTYSDLWSIALDEDEDSLTREVARSAINALENLEEENRILRIEKEKAERNLAMLKVEILGL